MSGDNWGNFRMDEGKEGSPAGDAAPAEPLSEPAPGWAGLPQPALLEPSQTMFVGPRGLRVGWRLLVYFIMWRALRMLLGVLLEDIDPHLHIKLWLVLM